MYTEKNRHETDEVLGNISFISTERVPAFTQMTVCGTVYSEGCRVQCLIQAHAIYLCMHTDDNQPASKETHVIHGTVYICISADSNSLRENGHLHRPRPSIGSAAEEAHIVSHKWNCFYFIQESSNTLSTKTQWCTHSLKSCIASTSSNNLAPNYTSIHYLNQCCVVINKSLSNIPKTLKNALVMNKYHNG